MNLRVMIAGIVLLHCMVSGCQAIQPEVRVTTVLGNGAVGASPDSGVQFHYPVGVAIDPQGRAVVLDDWCRLRRLTESSSAEDVAARFPGGKFADEATPDWLLGKITSQIAVGRDGTIYVGAYSSVWRLGADGSIAKLANRKEDFKDDKGAGEGLSGARSVALDSDGSLVVADTDNNAIRRIRGTGVVYTVAGTGHKGLKDGPASQAEFSRPSSVALDDKGNVYVCDTGNNCLRKITKGGQVSTIAGTGERIALVSRMQPGTVDCITGDASGNSHHTVDTSEPGIRRLANGSLAIVVDNQSGSHNPMDGPTGKNILMSPQGIALGTDGSIYFTEMASVRKLTRDGEVTTLAGSCIERGDKDGPGDTARFEYLTGSAPGANGEIIVCDTGCNKVKVISSSGFVRTLCGVSSAGAVADAAAATEISEPGAICVGPDGGVYLHDGGRRAIVHFDAAGRAEELCELPRGCVDVELARDEDGTLIIGAHQEGYGILGSDGKIEFHSARSATLPADMRLAVSQGPDGRAYLLGYCTDGLTAKLYRRQGNELRQIADVSTAWRRLGAIHKKLGTLIGHSGLRFACTKTGTVYIAANSMSIEGRAMYTHILGVDSAGKIVLEAGGPTGDAVGSPDASRFSLGVQLTCDLEGCLYISDAFSHKIKMFDGQQFLSVAGSGKEAQQDGPGDQASFTYPTEIAVGPKGELYVVDYTEGSVRRIDFAEKPVFKKTAATASTAADASMAADGKDRATGQVCYADGNHLWLRDLATGDTDQLSPDSGEEGSYHIPQWLDRNRVLFVYQAGSVFGKTKVGVLDTRTRSVSWIDSLSGAIGLGYDSKSGAIDYLKAIASRDDNMLFTYYLSSLVPSTGKKSSSTPFSGGYGLITDYSIVRRWPNRESRLLLTATSEVSDRQMVYDTKLRKLCEISALSRAWRKKALAGSYELMSVTPGPAGSLAGSFMRSGTNDRSVLCAVVGPGKCSTVADVPDRFISSPAFSADGKHLVWVQATNMWNGGDETSRLEQEIWAKRLSAGSQAVRLCSGWDPAWRP